ncbi:amidohydrolase family protein [Nonomuraea angiospora]|uniref:N-acyl-D-amino-acid deacylase n=1 Tax=Nonomuraea angiospora TaxID=46172 RepID=A0ABR9LVH6_9ACTN|nr:amidohydrolase family protein [Nonomuraea angiospora]MBE1584355.1 N-acyl-D-amino-acid deacylase [Nonomuraea angiospora]
MFDLLIKNGTVVDGSGAEPYPADVGLRADKIASVRPGLDGAAITIDATGMLVAPGLIDPHSHTDWSILGNRDAQSTIRQGVTTEVVGNCGVTYAPLTDVNAEGAATALRAYGYEGEADWRAFGELLERVHDRGQGGGTAQNLAWFVGHTALRNSGDATRHLEEALDAGALGMTSGLEYGSGRDATTAELLDLARIVGRRGGMYASHIRNRDAGLAAAVDEFFQVARADDGLRAQLSHLNVRHNTGADPGAWERAVERLATERERGLDVLADMTPYPDGIGLAVGLLPDWLLAGGAEEAARRLGDREAMARLRGECDRYWRFVHRGEWDRVTLATSPATPELEGKTFPDIAHELGMDEWDCFFHILRAAGPDMFAVQFIGRLFTGEHVAEAVAHPLFCLGVDGFSSRLDGPLAARTQHPLFFSGHLHYLAHHVQRQRTLSLAEAIHKMTAMVADHFGLAGRGRIAEGAWADLAVFDPAGLARLDTFQMPDRYPDCVPYVLVNGALVVDSGMHLGTRAGRQLKGGR